MSDRFLITDEAAAYLRVTSSTVARWRSQGIGPAYIKMQGRVLYSQESLEAHLKGQVRTGTRDTVSNAR